MNRLSIKMRVTIWYTAFMVLVLAAVLAAMLAISRSTVELGIREQLTAMVESNADELDYDDGVLELDDDFLFYYDGVYSFVYAGDGRLLYGNAVNSMPVDIVLLEGTPRSISRDGKTYYIYDRKVIDKKEGEAWVRGILDSDASYGLINTVSKATMVAFPVIIILAALGGYRISKRAFRPIEQINRTVNDINEGRDLSRRIEIGPGRDEVHMLADNFNSMFSRLESSFEAQRQFTADASHELRTPTAVIMAQCELALDSESGAEDYRQALLLIQRQSGKMTDIIGHLLDITRLEQSIQGTDMQHTDLSGLVETVCSDFMQAGVALQPSIQRGVTASVDKGLVSRMLGNLIQNAIKYGGDEIKVRLSSGDKDIIFDVEDNGPGIPMDMQDKIWRRFYQLNPSRGADSGAGLGLAMVRQIAELHGGRAEVISDEGKGSCFRITIPVSSS